MKGLTRTLAVALEAVGICAGVVGIGIEVAFKADVGFMCITGGAVTVAVGSLIFAKLIKWGD